MPFILVTNHQSAVPVTLPRLQALATAALQPCIEEPARENAPLLSLPGIEVSIVDDATIADIHMQFMNIPGATDVITFDHGEILISAETAVANASEFANDIDREIGLYIIHGLLHLNGHEDGEDEARQRMHKVQEKILKELWPA